MCGIGGAYIGDPCIVDNLLRLMKQTEQRGQDAFGVSRLREGVVETKRFIGPFSQHEVEAREFTTNCRRGDLLLWCNRAQPLTEPSSVDNASIQPVVARNMVAVHNGIVSNEEDLLHYVDKRQCRIDSEIPLHVIAEIGFPKAFELCAGGYAFAFLEMSGKLTLLRDFKTLWFGYVDNSLIFASEKEFLTNCFDNINLQEIPPYSYLQFVGAKKVKEGTILFKQISYLPPSDEDKVLVCSSGGIDSTTAAFVLQKIGNKKVSLVHFDYGQKSEAREWEAVKTIAEDLRVPRLRIPFKWLGKLGASALTAKDIPHPGAIREAIIGTKMWAPARNLAFVASLMSMAEALGARYISAGWNLEEESSYPDNSIEFLMAMNRVSDVGTLARPKLIMPLQRLMKPEEIIVGTHLGVDYSKTWSCDLGYKKHCGAESGCWNHHYAFLKAGIADPTQYLVTPDFTYKPPWEGKIVRSLSEIMDRIVLQPIS